MTTFTKEQLIEIIKRNITVMDRYPDLVTAQMDLEVYKIALASLEAEPVAYIFKHPAGKLFWALTDESNKDQSDVIPVYAAPPVPVVPAALPENDYEDGHDIDYLDPSEAYALGRTAGWNACRAAMLQGKSEQPQNAQQNIPENIPGGNSPVTPDGWISCSERMPEKNQNVLISVNFDSSLVEPLICSARYTGSTFRRGDVTIKPGNGIEQATHWMPLPEPPQGVNDELA
ncbi:DUF551 domain-containing protein [Escherichia coli]|uniref:DUF551 domain-containing protein n=1 Tax=Escherichia coli TaxID=562 RepID=UPI001C686486|nr:DUF551 domain-containing protein [Escherichia coli]QYD78518.1 DUF551 domain-containing protein [Escherichia coli]